jgi:hypothetical protein
MIITEYLEIAEIGDAMSVLCRRCGFRLSCLDDNYKSGCMVCDSQLADCNILIESSLQSMFIDDTVVFRQYFCPKCGVNIENEVCRKEDKPLNDISLEME